MGGETATYTCTCIYMYNVGDKMEVGYLTWGKYIHVHVHTCT